MSKPRTARLTASADADGLEAQEGRGGPDFAATNRVSCVMLAAAKDCMVKADKAHDDELVNLREMIIGAYGGPTAAKIFPGAAPEDPSASP